MSRFIFPDDLDKIEPKIKEIVSNHKVELSEEELDQQYQKLKRRLKNENKGHSQHRHRSI